MLAHDSLRIAREHYNDCIGPPRCNWINMRRGNLITRRIRESRSRRYPIFVRAHIHSRRWKFGSKRSEIEAICFATRPARDLSAEAFNNRRLYFRFISGGIDVTDSDACAIPSDRQEDIGFLNRVSRETAILKYFQHANPALISFNLIRFDPAEFDAI